ncbi:MAG TPA: monofunctional biosynthetic peptidoglycan transglycosylase [Steroidobacteraceae bacterium]|nr:monofunctional biosynthetic peptidoglycan transglycosylase [Steroidobacteraceae bacterium]
MRALLRLIGVIVVLGVLLSAVPVLAMRWWHPLTSAFMLSASLDAALAHDRRYRTQYEWEDLERISPNAALAVIAEEDQQFPFHAGFDFHSIREAVQASERGKRLRGASTISQQVAKNLFLWSGRSFARKALEAYLTVLLEICWPKERILEVYLNIAEFGRGVYGVQAAAQRFFHEPAARLTADQAALLATVLPNPRLMHVDRPSPYVLERRDWVLDQMRRLGGRAYLNTVEDPPLRSRHARAAPGGR